MSNNNAQLIHDKTMEVLGTVGMKFLHPEAIELLKKNGIKMDGQTAFFTEDQIMKYVEMAPSKCKIYARDSKYDIELGSGKTYIGPCMSAVKIFEPDGTLRPVMVEDVIKADKIVEYNKRYNIGAGYICTPSDIPADQLMAFQIYSSLMLSSKIPPDVCGDYKTMEMCYDILAASYGISKEELKNKPRMLAGMNINSPMFVDHNMTETLFTNLKYGQPCYMAPAGMSGTTAPITVAGTIVQTNAEVLATLALAQMYAPGAPVLYGSQSSASDMKTLAIAIGSPESALCYRYAGIMGQFYHIPVRSGGLMTDAKKLDVQAGYEAMMSFLACEQNHVDVVLQGAGVLDAYLSLSYEKMVSDFQVVDYADVFLKDIEIDEDSVPIEDMEEAGPGGSFVMADSTLENYSTAILSPIISARGSKPQNELELNTAKYIEKALASYKAPVIPEDCLAKMRELILAAGVDEAQVKKIEDARL